MKFDKAFLDLDGTVYLSGRLIGNIREQIMRLTDSGTRFYYMTNNTSISSDVYLEKLESLGLPVFIDSIISPTIVLTDWLLTRQIKRLFAVGTASFCGEVVNRADITLDEQDPYCVVVALDRELTYDKLEIACGLINRGIPYYITHIDLNCPSRCGPIPDCGAIGQLIESTTGVKPKGHFGKPGDLMLSHIRKMLLPNDKILVAGDRLYTDAEIGLRLGAAKTVLVCSGEFRPEHQKFSEQIVVATTLAEYLEEIVA